MLVGLALVFAGDRLRRVPAARAAAQPEGDRLEPVRGVLPGQLAVLRSEHLRALPRARDARAGGGPAVGVADARGGRRGGGARDPVGRAAADALAVELRRAAGGPCGAGRAAVPGAGRSLAVGGARGGGGRRGRRVPGRAAARPHLDRLDRPGDVGALRPHAGGVTLARERPVLGCGSGAFSREYRRQESASSERAVSASHTIPITVAAEQGIIGLAVYLALLAAALARLLRGAVVGGRGRWSRPASWRSSSTPGCTRRSSRTRSRGRCSGWAWRSRAGRRARCRAGVRPARPGATGARRSPAAGGRTGSRGAREVSAVAGRPAGGPRRPDRHRAGVSEPVPGAARARRSRRPRRPGGRRLGDRADLSPTTTPTTTWCGAASCWRGRRRAFEAYAAPTAAPALPRARRAARAARGGRGPRARARLPARPRRARGRRLPARRGRVRALDGPARRAFVASSASFLLYAARGYVDMPFLALVVWAGALEVERERKGGSYAAPATLLALAGLLRPEAWVLAGLYWLWALSPLPARRPRPAAIAGLTAACSSRRCCGALVDLAATGDPLYSLNATSELADDLGREQGLGAVPGAFVSFIGATVRPPVAVLAVIGAWLRRAPTRLGGDAGPVRAVRRGRGDLRRHRDPRAVDPAPLPHRPARSRCACSPATRSPASRRSRRRRRAAALGTGVGGRGRARCIGPRAGGAVAEGASPPSWRFIRDSHAGLVATLDAPPVRAGMRCGPLTFPNYRLVPDSRWHLDAPRTAVSARSARRRATGVAVFPTHPQGPAPLRVRRRRLADHQRARSRLPAGLPQRVVRGLRGLRLSSHPRRRSLPSRPDSTPSASRRSHSGAVLAAARSGPAPMRAASWSGLVRVPACERSAATNASASGATSTARSHVRTPARSGVDRAPAEPRVLEDPVGEAGVVERPSARRGRCRRRRTGSAAPPPRPSGARARRGWAPRGTRGSRRRRPTRRRATRRRAAARAPASPRPPARRSRQSIAVAEVPERDGDDRGARVGRGEAVGGERHQRGLAARRALEVGERLGGHEDEVGALAGERVQREQPLAHPLRRVVGLLVAVPAAVPELGVRVAGRAPRGPAGTGSGWKIATAAGVPGRRSRRPCAAARPSAIASGSRAERAIGQPRGIDRDDARRLQQVLGLVAEDEGLERPGEQQDQQPARGRVVGGGRRGHAR